MIMIILMDEQADNDGQLEEVEVNSTLQWIM